MPEAAVLASLGCGNPTALAELKPGEVVLELGSGGGIDVLLSARRVGPAGRAYGLDMTDDMLSLARKNAAEAGVTNVEFLRKGIHQGVANSILVKVNQIGTLTETFAAIDLATKGTGKTVLEAVRTSINPKVIDVPNPAMGRVTIDGVAKDGIGAKVKARVTVRSHLDRFVGGATEETIIARVGEGIVSAIGSADSYKDVLENPDRISKAVLAKGLDSNTAFEILSIDIADVDVGDNIGAKLQSEQANADKNIAQAKAEVRRAAAVAVEQEMRAKTQEMRAKVVEAEALVPQAMADAFRSGNLGIMDYVRMKNVQADTSMRESIAGGDKPRTES